MKQSFDESDDDEGEVDSECIVMKEILIDNFSNFAD